MRQFDPGPDPLANCIGLPYSPPDDFPFLSADTSSVGKPNGGPISCAHGRAFKCAISSTNSSAIIFVHRAGKTSVWAAVWIGDKVYCVREQSPLSSIPCLYRQRHESHCTHLRRTSDANTDANTDDSIADTPPAPAVRKVRKKSMGHHDRQPDHAPDYTRGEMECCRPALGAGVAL